MIAQTTELKSKRKQSGYTRAVRFTVQATADGVLVTMLDRKGEKGAKLRVLHRQHSTPGLTVPLPTVTIGGKTRQRHVAVTIRVD